ncbi:MULTISPECIES: hypothetical protein [unclassified Shewanella]|uniref:hypothetical protein n=1 Tax=unclassified Shewanella TaxID=196818 RepID=UPI0039B5FF21
MSSLSESDDLKQFKKTTWKSNLTRRVDSFREVINEGNNFEEFFGKEYLEKLTEKSARLNSLTFKLLIFYSIIMVSLYSAQNLQGVELRILGYSFKNLGYYKEFILFIAAIVTPVSALLTAYKKYIDALINECIAKIAPDENVRDFYKHIWVDYAADALFKKITKGEKVHQHGFSVLLAAFLALIFALILITLLLASFFIQIVVIYDVFVNPATPGYINKFVIVFALSSILFSWLVTIIQLPMPEVDYSNYGKIANLEKEDPERYKKVMDEISKEEAKKDAKSIILTSALAYLITFSGFSFIWYGLTLQDISVFLPKAVTGAMFVMFFSNEILGLVRKISYRRFFKNYPDESDSRTKAFSKLQKFLSFMKILSPILLTIIYSQYAYR